MGDKGDKGNILLPITNKGNKGDQVELDSGAAVLRIARKAWVTKVTSVAGHGKGGNGGGGWQE
eukprot:252254-Chlamydomonas_euryale.AAC.1